jgi:hypothetical protein
VVRDHQSGAPRELPRAETTGRLAQLSEEANPDHERGRIVMKVKIDIDCTPQEARTFFGLPHLEPMQDALLGKVQERLTEYLDTRDGEALLKLWFPAGLQNFAQMQEALWKQFMGGLAGSTAPGAKGKETR